jgi:serine protease Do
MAMKNSVGLVIAVLIISVLAGVLGGYMVADYAIANCVATHGASFSATSTCSEGTSTSTPVVVGNSTLNMPSLAPLVAKVRPAVVHIAVVSYVEQFNIFGGYSVVPQEGLGSGFFIKYDGKYYVVTNRHVVKDADNVTVKLYDGSAYKAKVLGTDDWSDIAVLKLINFPKDKPIHYLEWGDSSKVKVGDFVIAVGNPYGFDYTVTFGIISGKERTINEGNGVVVYDALQTDAAINPGNSGGPLVTMDGKVVGINTAIYAQAQGIGFSVSANTAKKVVDDILKYGHARWPYIGIYMVDVNEDMKEKLDLPFEGGVYVAKVVPGSPADKAGIQKGDIIIALNGEKIENSDTLARDIRQNYNPGDTVTLKIYRDGEYIEKTIVLGEKPKQQGR